MGSLSRDQWDSIRAAWEIGASMRSLAREYGISKTSISKRIAREGWVQEDVSAAIKARVTERVAGVVAGCPPEKKAAAIETEAGKRAAVLLRHREAWLEHAALVAEVLRAGDFEQAKLAKITAETLAIVQKSERIAWGLDHEQEKDVGPSPRLVLFDGGPRQVSDEPEELEEEEA